MADISLTSAQIAALTENGAIVRNYTAGAALTVGYAVYVSGNRAVTHSAASAAGTAKAIGVVVASYDGETSVASGGPAAVCVFGPVSGYTDGTAGAKAWVSNNAGRIADAAGTSAHELGYWENASILFVSPDPAGAGS